MANKKNLAAGIVANNPGTAGTSLVLETGYGQTMPEVPFFLTLTPPNQLSTMGNSEIVEITARTDDTLTMTRTQKGTTAQNVAEEWIAVNGVYIEDLAGGGYVAQDEAPEDTSLLWYDTDDEGIPMDAQTTILNNVYPVGTEYTNYVNPANPATLLQMPWSTWVAVEDTFTYGAGTKAAGATGGAETHTLTVTEIPPHGHSTGQVSILDSGSGTVVRQSDNASGGAVETSYTGGGGAHNNMPPYRVAYKWERTV